MLFQDLEGKTVVITGANRGIGKGIAEAFIRNHARVVAVYRKEKPMFSSQRSFFCEPLYLKSDVNNVQKVSRWLNDFEQKGNKIDILINNAGMMISAPLLKVSGQQWDAMMNTNLKSVFFLSQIFARHMKKNKKGVIINACSFADKIPSFSSGIYAASKAAVSMLTRVMAAEWAPYGIRVNAYSPGVIPTRMTAPSIKKNRKRMLSQISLHRFGTVEEIANGVLFLASNSSSYLTGVDLEISGGKLLIQSPFDAWKRKTS